MLKITKKERKNSKKVKEMRSRKGITLIALVITIIVLLILAGVSIATLTGDNGILTQANNAKEATAEAEEKEKINLAVVASMANQNAIIEESNLEENLKTQFGKAIDAKDNENGTFTIYMEESNKEYIVSNNGEMLNEGINWEKAKKETQKHPNQQEDRNQNVIGIGTDGKAVNMDLWEYTQLDDGTFALNDEKSVKYVDGAGSNVTKGYLGNFENGRIIGSIPQYISLDNGKSYKEVTNLWGTFFKCQELVYAPISPNTVTNMNLTFSQNTNLQDASYISYKSVDMWATYSRMFKTKGDTSFA